MSAQIAAQIERDIQAGRAYAPLTSYTQALAMQQEIQYRIEQDLMRRYMFPPSEQMYYHGPSQTIKQARTEMKSWLRLLQDDINTNHTRINALGVDPQHPVPAEDAKLMQTELNIRKLLADVLAQRANTEAAKQAMKG